MSRKTVTFLFLVFTSFALVDDSNGEICERIADVVFVIDASRSIWPPNFHKQLDFVKQVVQTFDIGLGKTRIGVLTFSDRTKKEFHMNTHDNKQDILDAITNIHFAQGDETNTFDALMVLRTDFFSERNGDRSGVPNIAIVLTDGESSDNTKTVHEANLTRKAGVVMFAIGIGANVNKTELEEIANSPKSDYMHALEDFNDLQTDTFKKLLSHMVCNALVDDTKAETCERIADVVFVIDSSRSIWPPNFNQQLDFVKQVVQTFDIGLGKTRIGALTFSDRTITEFYLNTHDKKQDILDAITNIHFAQGDETNTFDALMVLRTDFFSERNGDRSGVPNIAIVLTDGESSDNDKTVHEANLTRKAGVVMFAIGIGANVNKTELEEIANSPKSDYMHALENFNDLQSDTFKKLLSHTVCNVCQKKPVDVMFVLDVSGSLYRTDFTTQIRFVKSIVEDFDMDSGMVQVGVITFSKNAYLQFQLGKHKSKNATLDAIDRVNFYARSTNTAEALLVLLKQFQPHSGSRQGVDRIAFVITDGKSDDPVATEKMAKNVHEDGIDVSAIGVGNKYNITELQAIASKPTDQHVYLVNDYNALSSIKNYLASKACEG